MIVVVPVTVIVIVAMTMAIVMMIVMALAVAVVAMIFVLAVVIAVIVADFVVVLISAEMSFPAGMPAPVCMFAANRERPVIAEARVVIMIDIAVEADGPMEPRSRAEEDAALKPLRTVVAEGRALIRRVIEIAVWANRRDTDADRDLRIGFLRAYGKTEGSNSGQNQNPE